MLVFHHWIEDSPKAWRKCCFSWSTRGPWAYSFCADGRVHPFPPYLKPWLCWGQKVSRRALWADPTGEGFWRDWSRRRTHLNYFVLKHLPPQPDFKVILQAEELMRVSEPGGGIASSLEGKEKASRCKVSSLLSVAICTVGTFWIFEWIFWVITFYLPVNFIWSRQFMTSCPFMHFSPYLSSELFPPNICKSISHFVKSLLRGIPHQRVKAQSLPGRHPCLDGGERAPSIHCLLEVYNFFFSPPPALLFPSFRLFFFFFS